MEWPGGSPQHNAPSHQDFRTGRSPQPAAQAGGACRVLERDGWTVLSVRMLSPASAAVVLVAIVWNLVVWTFIGSGRGSGSLVHTLFVAAFALAGAWSVVWSLVHLFGHYEVRLRGKEGQAWVGIGGTGWTRRFDAGRVLAVRFDQRRIETRTGHRIEKSIALDIGGPGPIDDRGGSTLRLARFLPEARRRWLGEMLGAVLERER